MAFNRQFFRFGWIFKLVLAIGFSFIVAALVVRYAKSYPSEAVLPLEGFNYRLLLNDSGNDKPTWRGPRVGERIDLALFTDQNGNTLKDALNNGPAMLAVVNPNCAMCKVSGDQMRTVRDRLSTVGIKYYIVSPTPDVASAEVFAFADTLNTDVPVFVWSRRDIKPAPSLVGMVTPSHLLLDPGGVVIGRWPGSNEHKDVRDRMANQIVSDSLMIADVIVAMKHGATIQSGTNTQ